MMRSSQTVMMILCLAALCLAASGCSSSTRSVYRQPRPLLLVAAGRPNYTAATSLQGSLPWYASRNDAQLATTFGYRSTMIETSNVLTYERLHQDGNRVHNHLRVTTYRSRTQQLVR